jgi:lipoprotein-releasing system permease protein
MLRLNRYQWTVLFAAWLGWGFDIFDGLLFNFVAPNAIPTLLGLTIGSPEARTATLYWTGVITAIFLVGWAVGGVLFGPIADRYGRKRVLLITMVLYALGTALCAFVTSIEQLIVCRIILGAGLARALRVRVGDRIEIWSPAMAERAEKGKAPLPAEFEVCAVIVTGFTEVDNAAALIPLRRFREIWNLGPRAHGLTLRLKQPALAEAIAGRLAVGHPELRFRPWQDIKKDFLAAIRFEKTMLFFLMFIITLVASFSIGSTLFSAVIRRSREVGVLASLGAARWQVVALFGLQGLLIGALGTSLGFVLTWTILAFRDGILSGINAFFGDGDMMANIYQFSKVPLHYDASDFVIAAAFTLLTTAIAGLVPALWAAGRKPSEAMRDA